MKPAKEIQEIAFAVIGYRKYEEGISKEIEDAAALGLMYIIVDVPHVFFETLLKELEQWGYNVKYEINISNGNYKLTISWNV